METNTCKILHLHLLHNRSNYTLNFDKDQRENVDYIVKGRSLSPGSLFEFRRVESEKNPDRIRIRTEKGWQPCEVKCRLTAAAEGSDETKFEVKITYAQEGVRNRNSHKDGSETAGDSGWTGWSEWCGRTCSPGYEKVKVVFILCTDGKETIERYVNFTCCDEIFNVVLDFGSEASQMAIYKRGADSGVNSVVRIFPSVKSHFGDKADAGLADGEYVQYCDVEELYKSQFYIKETISSFPESYWKYDKSNEVMSFLSKRSDLDNLGKHYIALPNTKIAGLGNVRMKEVILNGEPCPFWRYGNYCYRKSVDNFISEAFRKIKTLKEGSKTGAYICILMPNVYSLPTINEKLSNLSTDIRGILADDEFKDKIAGYELTYVSESDASMLGLFAKNLWGTLGAPEGNYLIMDAGKGTLDFSVLNYYSKRSPVYKNICRSGIVGAGNAITYAIALALIADFAELKCGVKKDDVDSAVRQIVCDKIVNADLAEQLTFLNLVEQYKIKLNGEDSLKGKRPSPTPEIEVGEVQLSGLNNFIGGCDYKVPDPHNYISNEIDNIAIDVLKKLTQVTNRLGGNEDQIIRLDKVIFTGRGFLMNEFRDRIFLSLQQLEPEIKICDMEGFAGHEKDICLFIASLLSSGGYDVSLDGTPVLLEKKSQEKSGKKKDAGDNRHPLSDFLEKIGEYVAPDLEDDETEVISSGDFTDNKGFTLHSFSDLVNIGGVAYSLLGLPDNLLNKPAQLFFDGEEFLIGIAGKAYGLNIDNGTIDQSHVFQSMFPNVNITKAEEVVIPLTPGEHVESTAAASRALQQKLEESSVPGTVEDIADGEEADSDETEGGFFENLKHLLRKMIKNNEQ